jgi:hypothetical protein
MNLKTELKTLYETLTLGLKKDLKLILNEKYKIII